MTPTQSTSVLVTLSDDPHAGINAIADCLDSCSADERRAELDGLSRDRQRLLYAKASAAAPLTFEHFVGSAEPLVEVIHDGFNTLPLPAPMRRFQKRFCRPDVAEQNKLYGYNEGSTRKIVGPGYFTTISTSGRPHWQAHGAIVIDYYQVPQTAVVAGWPTVVPNDWRLSRFVYNQTRDFMRRVSNHVSIGAAYKGERPLDHYITLCRQG